MASEGFEVVYLAVVEWFFLPGHECFTWPRMISYYHKDDALQKAFWPSATGLFRRFSLGSRPICPLLRKTRKRRDKNKKALGDFVEQRPHPHSKYCENKL